MLYQLSYVRARGDSTAASLVGATRANGSGLLADSLEATIHHARDALDS